MTSIWTGSYHIYYVHTTGVDSSVRVVYKPVHRLRSESGLINVSVNFTFTQVTEVNNTRDEATILHFTDQIPLSRDDKLKVCYTIVLWEMYR